MAKGHARSAITGQYIPRSTATRQPRTSVVESGGNGSAGTHHRSAITGRFLGPAAAARWPKTTVTERG